MTPSSFRTPHSEIPPMTPLPAPRALDQFFLDARARLLDLAAMLDRIDRGAGTRVGGTPTRGRRASAKLCRPCSAARPTGPSGSKSSSRWNTTRRGSGRSRGCEPVDWTHDPRPVPPARRPRRLFARRPAAGPRLGQAGRAGRRLRPAAGRRHRLHDRLWVVDFTARVQAFDLDGKHLGLTFRTPDYRNGRPSGLGIDRDGKLIVADSHYHCIRVYDADGKERARPRRHVREGPGQFGYVSDVVQDADGFFYLSEFGENDRITKLDADGSSWHAGAAPAASRGSSRGCGRWPWGRTACSTWPTPATTASRCSRRDGELVRAFGARGERAGRVAVPLRPVASARAANCTWPSTATTACRSSRPTGEPLGPGAGRAAGRASWPTPGRGRGPPGRVHVIDTENHRVQRVQF